MAVSADAVPLTAPPAGPARPATARGTRRRDLLRGLLAASAALAIVPAVTATRPRRRADGGLDSFDETYLGRRIRGLLTTAGTAGAGHAEWTVTVDGRPLHLMRRADGTWLSMVDHYRSYATPLEAARAAVDELGPGQRLREAGPAHHDDTHIGGHHGLHP
ncbi:tyrosinase family oxidase copper chaperone [Streptomyces sp. ID05-04B]|uniref:tyrosinase family oxidase copper chaperone n=1 Tax=unclassified Streptomyces TaxID=2593676 RepID=UPI000D1B6005|nr:MULTISPECIES: tyrosinase family oxidase copper chaperone [unclassified Streptomyces]AVV42542.1 tyrosinase co-factor [Streptomyces sp. P3]MDX5566330.1 tyrosinase family oxidase copper chaperone [Streptomyces sp. ID05-04B]